MVQERAVAGLQLRGGLRPAPAARSNGRADQRDRQGHAPGRRADPVDLGREHRHAGEPTQQLAGHLAGQHADLHHLGGGSVQDRGVPGGVQYPPGRADRAERGHGGSRPHVIHHQQAAALRQYVEQ